MLTDIFKLKNTTKFHIFLQQELIQNKQKLKNVSTYDTEKDYLDEGSYDNQSTCNSDRNMSIEPTVKLLRVKNYPGLSSFFYDVLLVARDSTEVKSLLGV